MRVLSVKSKSTLSPWIAFLKALLWPGPQHPSWAHYFLFTLTATEPITYPDTQWCSLTRIEMGEKCEFQLLKPLQIQSQQNSKPTKSKVNSSFLADLGFLTSINSLSHFDNCFPWEASFMPLLCSTQCMPEYWTYIEYSIILEWSEPPSSSEPVYSCLSFSFPLNYYYKNELRHALITWVHTLT